MPRDRHAEAGNERRTGERAERKGQHVDARLESDDAGDLRPNSGSTTETINRLFGGSLARFRPQHRDHQTWPLPKCFGTVRRIRDGVDHENQVVPTRNAEYEAATQLCRLGTATNIDCGIIAVVGKHDWPYAAVAFATALPWLAAQVGTAGSPR
jgi:hypothetical protein